jgi:hypothetical protein
MIQVPQSGMGSYSTQHTLKNPQKRGNNSMFMKEFCLLKSWSSADLSFNVKGNIEFDKETLRYPVMDISEEFRPNISSIKKLRKIYSWIHISEEFGCCKILSQIFFIEVRKLFCIYWLCSKKLTGLLSNDGVYLLDHFLDCIAINASVHNYSLQLHYMSMLLLFILLVN